MLAFIFHKKIMKMAGYTLLVPTGEVVLINFIKARKSNLTSFILMLIALKKVKQLTETGAYFKSLAYNESILEHSLKLTAL